MQTATRRPYAAILCLAMVLVALVAGCGDDDDSDGGGGTETGEVTEVRIGTQPWIGYGPFWIADEQGFDEDNGVNIELVNFSGRQELEAGFASGKFDAANSATNDVIRLADLGIDFKITLMEDFSLQADAILSCNPDIRSLDDIGEGTSVAFEEFSVSDVLFRYAANEAGIDFDSLEYVPAPPSDAGAAVAAGRVDVAATYEPYLQAALEENEDCEVLYTANERPGLISDVLAVNTEFAEGNPDAIAGVLAAWGDAVDFYEQNTEEAQAIIADNVGEKPDALRASFEGVRLFGLDESHEYLENDYADLWADVAGILLEQGQIDSEPSIDDYLDTSFGDEALNRE